MLWLTGEKYSVIWKYIPLIWIQHKSKELGQIRHFSMSVKLFPMMDIEALWKPSLLHYN